jgi:bifunctional non-homologous end joining protein LigD
LLERHHGIRLNATYDGDGAVIYKHACALGCEGIVSKRLGSPYCAGRTDQWLKMKNPKAPAVRRERDPFFPQGDLKKALSSKPGSRRNVPD